MVISEQLCGPFTCRGWLKIDADAPVVSCEVGRQVVANMNIEFSINCRET